MRLVTIFLLGLAGCHPSDSFSFTNQGVACYDAGTVTIEFDDCASACAANVVTTCSVDVDADGGRVVVTGTLDYEVPQGDCVAMCAVMSTSCAAEVPDGEWTLVYGSGVEPLTVPGGETCAASTGDTD